METDKLSFDSIRSIISKLINGQKVQKTYIEEVHELLLLIATAGSQCSGENADSLILTRAFPAYANKGGVVNGSCQFRPLVQLYVQSEYANAISTIVK